MTGKGSGITLKDDEIKDHIKLFKSLENRGILLKRTTTKIASQEGRFLNLIRPLMKAGIPLMKSVLTPLAKSVLLPFDSQQKCQQQMQLFKKLKWIRN